MNAAAIPWLPANALDDGALSSALDKCAIRWSAHWFAETKPVVIRIQAFSGATHTTGDGVCLALADASITLTAPALTSRLIASWMLGIPHGAQRLSKADQALLEGLGAASLKHLLEEIGRTFRFSARAAAVAPTDDRVFAGLKCSMSIAAASQLVEIYIHRTAAIMARRALIAPALPKPSPAPRSAGLDRQPICVGAMVGIGRISLVELSALQCGDVLILDQGPGEVAPLTINGRKSVDAACRLICDDDDFKLRIE